MLKIKMKCLPSWDSHAAPPLRIRLPSQVKGHADLLCRCIFFLEIDPWLVWCSLVLSRYKAMLETVLLQSSASESSGKWACGLVLSLTQIKLFSKASLVGQWSRILLPVQGTQVWSLVWEDPAPQLLKAEGPRACAPQEEKQAQWEAHGPQLKSKLPPPLNCSESSVSQSQELSSSEPHTPSKSWKAPGLRSPAPHQVTSENTLSRWGRVPGPPWCCYTQHWLSPLTLLSSLWHSSW